MPSCQPAPRATQHVTVRVEQRDLGLGRRVRLIDEVPRPWTDIEVPTPEVPLVTLDHRGDRDVPDGPRHEAQDPRVVDREHQRVVAGLALVGRVVAIQQGRWCTTFAGDASALLLLPPPPGTFRTSVAAGRTGRREAGAQRSGPTRCADPRPRPINAPPQMTTSA